MSSKASLAEIFSAMSGIITEGANLSRQGVKIADNTLVSAASDGAMKMWDARYKACNRPLSSDGDQEHIARPLLRFLASALPVLREHETTGNVARIREHIHIILKAEISDEPRVLERFKDGGVLAKPFKADYQSKASTEPEDPTTLAEESAADDVPAMEDGAQADVVPVIPAVAAAKRGRPSAKPQPAFV